MRFIWISFRSWKGEEYLISRISPHEESRSQRSNKREVRTKVIDKLIRLTWNPVSPYLRMYTNLRIAASRSWFLSKANNISGYRGYFKTIVATLNEWNYWIQILFVFQDLSMIGTPEVFQKLWQIFKHLLPWN